MSSEGIIPEDEDWDRAQVEMTRKLSAMQVRGQVVPAAVHAAGAWAPPPSSTQKVHAPPQPPTIDAQLPPPASTFTPSSTVSSPVSRATATAVSLLSPLDPVLVAALENPRERLTLLQFEDQIVTFLKSPREYELVLPSLSSYHRLIVHRLAERCHLEHQTADYYHATGYDPNAARVVTLFKTPRCAVPSILLIDLAADTAPPAPTHHTPANPPKIMSRKKGAGAAHKHHKTPSQSADTRSMQDREKAYAEARARIFGEESPGKPAASSASSSSEVSPSTKASAASSRPAHQHHGSHQAAHHQDWKQSKAQYRDRQKEMNDPDFTRHHQPRAAYVYSGAPQGHGSRYTAPHEFYNSQPPPSAPFQADGYYRHPPARTFQPRPAYTQPASSRHGPPPSYSMDTDFPPLG